MKRKTDPASRFAELKRDAERLKSQQARAEGELDGLLKQLKNEFGVKSLKAARKLLAELEQQAEEKRRRFTDALCRFEKEWRG